MGINETLVFFQNLKTNTNEKSEIKLYDKYILILTNLKNRDLTETQILNIETEFEKLNLNAEAENKIKYLKKKLSDFQADDYQYLNTNNYNDKFTLNTNFKRSYNKIPYYEKWIYNKHYDREDIGSLSSYALENKNSKIYNNNELYNNLDYLK